MKTRLTKSQHTSQMARHSNIMYFSITTMGTGATDDRGNPVGRKADRGAKNGRRCQREKSGRVTWVE